MRRAFVAAGLSLAACGPKAVPSNIKGPDVGISISIYRDGASGYAVVDDRRWVEIRGSSILLGNIDPGAALASLVIETGGPALAIGPCTRERLPDVRDLAQQDKLDEYARTQELLERRRRLERERVPRRYRRPEVAPPRAPEPVKAKETFAPIVQCDVAGAAGRHLVRIVYISTTMSYRVQHDIELTDPDRARIASRFAVVTPPWRERADLTLFDGVPGGVEPPRELARGPVTLDGGTSVLVLPERELPAQLRHVFAGIAADSENDLVDATSVWATLEVPGVKLAPGPVRVHVALADSDERWIDIQAPRLDRFADDDALAREKRADEPLRLKLWVDNQLRGARQRMIVENDGTRMVEVVALSMVNNGDTPREVWIEEHARSAKRRQIERAWPKKPSARGDTLRTRMVVKPGRTERAGYTIVYDL